MSIEKISICFDQETECRFERTHHLIRYWTFPYNQTHKTDKNILNIKASIESDSA